MIGNSDDEINFPLKLLLTNREVADLRKTLQIIYQLISSYRKLNQEDFLVDFLVHC